MNAAGDIGLSGNAWTWSGNTYRCGFVVVGSASVESNAGSTSSASCPPIWDGLRLGEVGDVGECFLGDCECCPLGKLLFSMPTSLDKVVCILNSIENRFTYVSSYPAMRFSI